MPAPAVSATPAAAPLPESDFSLIRGDPWFRLQRRLRLIPARGLGIGRRALCLALLTWLPLAAWALLDQGHGAAFLRNFPLHVRCLLSIPLLVAAEATLDRGVRAILAEIPRRDLLGEDAPTRWSRILERTTRLRCSPLPWALLLAVVATFTLSGAFSSPREFTRLALAAEPGFGGFWLMYAVRPLFFGLVLVWLWRLVLLIQLFWSLSRLPLDLAPTHADRFGGFGMLELLPSSLSPVVLAASTVLGADAGYRMLHHGSQLQDFALPALTFLVVVLAVVLAPQASFAPVLLRTRIRGVLDYGELLSRHGRLVRHRWVLRRQIPEDPVLDAPELGPVADINTLYAAVTQMNPVAIGWRSLAAPVAATLLPLLPLVLIEVPLTEALKDLVGALF